MRQHWCHVRTPDSEYINAGFRDLDDREVCVRNANGFGACDVTIGGHTMTWRDLDKLKEAIAEAEKAWRPGDR